MVETWRPIPGWEDWYSVSDQGRVQSHDRVSVDRNGRTMRWQGRILAARARADGRRRVCLTDGTRKETRLVYHLVLETFTGPRPDGLEARHWNDVPSDDRLENLFWGTSSENKQDMIRNQGRTHCANGHTYTDETTYWYGNTRQCRICRATPSSARCGAELDCGKPVLSRGMCSKHYNRWRRHGDPLQRSA